MGEIIQYKIALKHNGGRKIKINAYAKAFIQFSLSYKLR